MDEFGYTRDHAAASLSIGKSHLIGISFPLSDTSLAFSSNPFYGEFLGAFQSVIRDSEYDAIIGANKSADQFERWYKSRALDGVVILGQLPLDLEEKLVSMKARVVLVGVYEDYAAPITNIRINDENGEISSGFLFDFVKA